MIREEEDDITQEMRQLVMVKVAEELVVFIKKIEEAKPRPKPKPKPYRKAVHRGVGVKVISGM